MGERAFVLFVVFATLTMSATAWNNLAKPARTILWFRNDLRVHDNPMLNLVAKKKLDGYRGDMVCVYCFDPRTYTATDFSPHKTGIHRSQFLIESVDNLRKNLRRLGSELLVAIDRPELLIPQIAKGCNEIDVLVQSEVTSEEIIVERNVETILRKLSTDTHRCTLHRIVGGQTLYHPADLPYPKDFNTLSDIFSSFRAEVEGKECRVRFPLPSLLPGMLPGQPVETQWKKGHNPTNSEDCHAKDGEIVAPTIPLDHYGFDYLPQLVDLGFSLEEISQAGLEPPPPLSTAIPSSPTGQKATMDVLTFSDIHKGNACQYDLKKCKGVMQFRGGEDAAMQRIQQWMFNDDNLKDYFNIRNGMLGEAYSSKLSPWLAAGCISPRQIYAACKRYETERQMTNKSTYWLVFELLVRDFFRFFCVKHGDRVFLEYGACGGRDGSNDRAAVNQHNKPWNNADAEKISRWKTGTTGQPLVDANMRELLHTGWMSNRGRQNVASYLVLDLGVDWRVGADHFESLLLDHDVCSNYGNWNAAAGLTEKRLSRFNCVKQSKDYDPQGEYIKHWVPELESLPVPMVFNPSAYSKKQLAEYGVRIADYNLHHHSHDGKSTDACTLAADHLPGDTNILTTTTAAAAAAAAATTTTVAVVNTPLARNEIQRESPQEREMSQEGEGEGEEAYKLSATELMTLELALYPEELSGVYKDYDVTSGSRKREAGSGISTGSSNGRMKAKARADKSINGYDHSAKSRNITDFMTFTGNATVNSSSHSTVDKSPLKYPIWD